MTLCFCVRMASETLYIHIFSYLLSAQKVVYIQNIGWVGMHFKQKTKFSCVTKNHRAEKKETTLKPILCHHVLWCKGACIHCHICLNKIDGALDPASAYLEDRLPTIVICLFLGNIEFQCKKEHRCWGVLAPALQ
jgi:hypothetical protein